MSISDMIVVMKAGSVQQIGRPQQVYDDPANLFVAQFLGTPAINVFDGELKDGMLYIGPDAVQAFPGLKARSCKVTAGIRPEGFIPDPEGPMHCRLRNVEIMGRDVSIVSNNDASRTGPVRSIIQSDGTDSSYAADVRFRLKPAKVLLFDSETGERIR